ncbi:MAG: dynamin family protein [Cyanobacteriota bacterium]|nr:dynamin family protein [Cyanobacteriota bacterium]
MVQLPNFFNKKPGNTQQALDILNNIKAEVTQLLEQLNAQETGYLSIKELLDKIFEDITDATQRIAEETIRIGILGGRGSGKSTLANSLMGNDLLPESAIVFCTSIPTTIRYSRQYKLEVCSQLKTFNIDRKNISPDEMRSILNDYCKESNNRNNEKKITKISIGVPSRTLESKEIVDVPGFTKGNPLHQAFAEQYAKYYCDVCLVLVNNFESIEINSVEGLTALTKTFENRLDSTVFIINKCDQSSDSDIDYIQQELSRYLKGENFHFFRVSAKNSLMRSGDAYDFTDLVGYLGYLNSRKIVILVKSLLERLISNFTAFRELCHLSNNDLGILLKDMNELLDKDFNVYSSELRARVSKDSVLDNDSIPSLDITEFDLPNVMGTRGLLEYSRKLAESLSIQSNEKASTFAQKYQANIYKRYNEMFEAEVEKFIQDMRLRISEFESKFGISSLIQIPKAGNIFHLRQFDPNQIERLKPSQFRIWLEEISPSALNREIKFWTAPISITSGLLDIKISLPIGLRQPLERTKETREGLSKQAIELINEYLFEALNEFVCGLNDAYNASLDNFLENWEKNIQSYIQHIEMAQSITGDSSLRKTDEFIETMNELYVQVSTLLN